jgi:hypothetical protein
MHTLYSKTKIMCLLSTYIDHIKSITYYAGSHAMVPSDEMTSLTDTGLCCTSRVTPGKIRPKNVFNQEITGFKPGIIFFKGNQEYILRGHPGNIRGNNLLRAGNNYMSCLIQCTMHSSPKPNNGVHCGLGHIPTIRESKSVIKLFLIQWYALY